MVYGVVQQVYGVVTPDSVTVRTSKKYLNRMHSSQIESASHLPHLEINSRNSTTKISIQKSTHVPSNAITTMIPGKPVKPGRLKQVLGSHLSIQEFLEIYNTTCPVKNISNICPCIPPHLGKSHFGTFSNYKAAQLGNPVLMQAPGGCL